MTRFLVTYIACAYLLVRKQYSKGNGKTSCFGNYYYYFFYDTIVCNKTINCPRHALIVICLRYKFLSLLLLGFREAIKMLRMREI